MKSILVVFNLFHSLLGFVGGNFLSQEVLFESLESKTREQDPVYNSISLNKKKNQDIWTMKQSHRGVHAQINKWDHIQIIVHKEKRPYQVSYHQLGNGKKEIEYKTSCLRCHANGPRLIRPNIFSKKAPLPFKKRLTITYWNQLIKSYGETTIKENNPFARKTPLGKKAGKSLKLKACTTCHYAGGPRGELTKSHINTIKYLVQAKEMPPWPHTLSKNELRELKRFLYGF